MDLNYLLFSLLPRRRPTVPLSLCDVSHKRRNIEFDALCLPMSYECAGEGAAINITLVTAHQLMFIAHDTLHLKRENAFHLCLE